jgi:pantoate kinase
MSNVATVSKIKEASKAMLDALEMAPAEKRFRLQVGITLQPQGNLSSEEVKTAIRKYHQAVSNFDENLQAAMVFDLAAEDSVLQDIFKRAQASITPVESETQSVEAAKA